MSQNVLNVTGQVPSATSNASQSHPHLQDFTALASALQDMAQVLLNYSHTGQGNTPAPEQVISRQLDSSSPASSYPSKRVKKKDRFKALDLNIDISDFADKDLGKSFDNGYKNGFFRDEIRYYYVPAHFVRSEYKWLQQQKQNTIPDALSMVYNELELKIKLLGYLGNEANPQELPLAQLNESILQPLRLLQNIHTHLNSFTLIHKTMLHNGPNLPITNSI